MPLFDRDFGEPLHTPINASQAQALAQRWAEEWKVEPKRPFFPPESDLQLEEAMKVPGVVYRFDPEFQGIEFRRKGRAWFTTGLPVWEFPEEVLGPIRDQMRDIIARRTHSVGFKIELPQ